MQSPGMHNLAQVVPMFCVAQWDMLAGRENATKADDDAPPRPQYGQGISEADLHAEIGEISDYVGERLRAANRAESERRKSTYERVPLCEHVSAACRARHRDLPVFGEGWQRRSHVVDMLDAIEDENGPVMADRTLAYLRKAFNWFAARNEDFTNPIVKGIRRVSTNSRDRVLADDELRDLWAALDVVENVPACYPRFVKSLLLTTTRRTEAALMHSSEIDSPDWTIPADRYKTSIDHVIPLSAAARELIGEKPAGASGNSWFIFTTTQGAKGFSGFSKAKRELDKAIAKIRSDAGREPMPHWVLHDLRRTGRSLMSRAGVPADHAERCLGHVIGGVRGVYDRYAYLEEKRDAFNKLADLVSGIITATPTQDQKHPHPRP